MVFDLIFRLPRFVGETPPSSEVPKRLSRVSIRALLSVFTWKLILDPPFGSTICLYFWCMVSGIFFCGEAGEGGLSEYGGSDDIAGIMIS